MHHDLNPYLIYFTVIAVIFFLSLLFSGVAGKKADNELKSAELAALIALLQLGAITHEEARERFGIVTKPVVEAPSVGEVDSSLWKNTNDIGREARL